VERDSNWVFLGVVGFATLVATFIMVGPLLDVGPNIIGSGVNVGGFELPEYYQEVTGSLILGIPATVSIGKRTVEFELITTDTVLIDGEQHTLGAGVLLDPTHYLEVVPQTDVSKALEHIDYRLIHPKFTNTCADLTQQTIASGANAACCSGVLTALPDCSDPDAQGINCGGNFIECDAGVLKSQYTGGTGS
jgi:hypothetical protein